MIVPGRISDLMRSIIMIVPPPSGPVAAMNVRTSILYETRRGCQWWAAIFTVQIFFHPH